VSDHLRATEPSAVRGRGRPCGTTYPDQGAIEAMREIIVRSAQSGQPVESLRPVARAVAPSAFNWGRADPLSTIKRLEIAFRDRYST
jgi:hypothetical protein